MRPCSVREAVARSGAILHVIALVPEPLNPRIQRCGAANDGFLAQETAATGDMKDSFGSTAGAALSELANLMLAQPPRLSSW